MLFWREVAVFHVLMQQVGNTKLLPPKLTGGSREMYMRL